MYGIESWGHRRQQLTQMQVQQYQWGGTVEGSGTQSGRFEGSHVQFRGCSASVAACRDGATRRPNVLCGWISGWMDVWRALMKSLGGVGAWMWCRAFCVQEA